MVFGFADNSFNIVLGVTNFSEIGTSRRSEKIYFHLDFDPVKRINE